MMGGSVSPYRNRTSKHLQSTSLTRSKVCRAVTSEWAREQHDIIEACIHSSRLPFNVKITRYSSEQIEEIPTMPYLLVIALLRNLPRRMMTGTGGELIGDTYFFIRYGTGSHP
jgi:hypothetical protein